MILPTAQEAFNIVAAHLQQQKYRAFDPKSYSCRYRGEFGSKCAVGVLIPDELYSTRLEGCTIADGTLVSYFNEGDAKHRKFGAWLKEHHQLLHNLQSLHDVDMPSRSLVQSASKKQQEAMANHLHTLLGFVAHRNNLSFD